MTQDMALKPRLFQGTPQQAQAATFPAPLGGVKATENLFNMDPRYSVFCYNLTPSEYGLRTRKGDSVHVEYFPSGEVARTLIAYEGTASDHSDDRLFAITKEGIYDVTTKDNTNPQVPVLSWPSSSNLAGYGVFTNFTTTAGAKYLLYADSVHGLYVYTESTGTWALATGITGVAPADIRYVTVHHKRLWFAENDTTNGWYLGVGAITGAATQFSFGAQFRYGGELVAVESWSIDGGAGMDDHLVAISRAGDIVVYQGYDPAAASTFSLKGSWYIGEIPYGRQCCSRFGGNLYILCVAGLVDMKSIASALEANVIAETGITSPIERIIRDRMPNDKDTAGWNVEYIPSEGVMVIIAPDTGFGEKIQYVMDVTTKAWTLWRGKGIRGAVSFAGDFYWGADDLTVRVDEGSLDGVAYDGTGGDAVPFSILTAYSDLQQPAMNKIVQFIRAVWIAAGEPTYTAKALYDYDLNEIINTATPVALTGDLWDSGLWDTALWGGGKETFQELISGADMGRVVAVAMRGETSARATLVSWDLMWTSGGYL